VLALAVVLLAGCAVPGSDLTGDPAPGFQVYDTESRPVNLSAMAGEPVVLFFMSVTCGTCSIEQKHELVPLEKELGDDVNFITLTIGEGEGNNHLRDFKQRTGADWPHCIDSQYVHRDYDIYLPSYVVVLDEDHKIVLKDKDPPKDKIRSALGL
jgi:peroxiredoxin